MNTPKPEPKPELNWPVPTKDEPTETGAALRHYDRETAELPSEAAAYGRVLTRLDSPSTRPRWLVAIGATVVAVPILLWVLRHGASPEAVPAPLSASLPSATVTSPAGTAAQEASAFRLAVAPAPLPTGKLRLEGGITALLTDDTTATARLVAWGADRLRRSRTIVGGNGNPSRVPILEQGTVDIALAMGSIELHVPPRGVGQAVLLTADPFRFMVVGTVFTLSHTAHRLALEVSDGLVTVSRDGDHLATVASGETWSTSLPPSNSRRDDSAARVARQSSAQECAAAKQVQEQLACYRKKARKSGPDGERAQYALARLLRDGVSDLAAALDAFEEQRSRFPRGKLEVEAHRAIIDLLVRLGRHPEALAETQLLLDAHPEAEYRAEIRLVRGDIYRAIMRDPTSAEREYDEGAEADGRTGDDSRFLRALCLEALGKMDEARLAYQEYLAQAGTAHAREAKRRMERLSR